MRERWLNARKWLASCSHVWLIAVGHRKGWSSLLTFTLRTTNIIYPDRYAVYINAPLELTKEGQRKADAALLELLEGQEKGPSAKGETKRRDSTND